MYLAWQPLQLSRGRWLLRSAGLALLVLLGACGFTMHGTTPLPFDTLYVGIPDNTRFGADVRRALRAASPDTKLVKSPKEAQAILQQISDQRTLRDVSLNAQGRVEEYELGLNFTFRLIDAKGNALLADTTLSIYREMPYDDQLIQAKQGQIETLYRSMQQALVARLIRRLTAPDIHAAMAAAASQEHVRDENAPVFDPASASTPRNLPTPWQQPTITPGIHP